MPQPPRLPTNIRHLEQLTDDMLFQQLGYALFEIDAGGALPRPPKLGDLIARAQQWLADQHQTIATIICQDTSLRELVESKPSAREKIVLIIGNVLAAHFVGIPIATLAEILFRSGVSSYCASTWHS
jgi:hypothetical protein